MLIFHVKLSIHTRFPLCSFLFDIPLTVLRHVELITFLLPDFFLKQLAQVSLWHFPSSCAECSDRYLLFDSLLAKVWSAISTAIFQFDRLCVIEDAASVVVYFQRSPFDSHYLCFRKVFGLGLGVGFASSCFIVLGCAGHVTSRPPVVDFLVPVQKITRLLKS